MPPATFNRPRLPALTTIRYFAALWVAYFHLFSFGLFPASDKWLCAISSIGYCGVSFFFVLSGFILVYTYAGRATTLGSFWQARFARIYPAFLFALLVNAPWFFGTVLHANGHVFIYEAFAARHLVTAVLLCLTLLQSWVPLASLTWNIPAWSLSAEAFFYLVFPFALARFLHLSRKQWIALIPACWLVGLVAASTYVHLHPDGLVMNGDIFSPAMNFIKFNPLMRLPEFLIGMSAGLLFINDKGDRRRAWPLILVSLAAIAAIVFFSNSIPYPVIHTAVLSPAFALFVYGVALRPVGIGLLETRWMEALGEASYPFYLLHAVIAFNYFHGFQTGHPAHDSLFGILGWLLLTTAVAILVDHVVERPLRKLLRPRKKIAAEAAVA